MTGLLPPGATATTQTSGPSRYRLATARSRPWAAPLVVLAALIAMWETAVRMGDIPDYVLPAPSAILEVLLGDADVLLGHTVATTSTALLGLVLATVAGVLVAGLLAGWGAARRALLPLLVVSQSIPMVVLAPILVVWFGFGLLPRVLVVALVGFFPIAIATAGGLLAASRDHLDLLRALGGTRWDLARHVEIPGAMPSLFTGLKLAGTYAMFGAVVGEWIGASQGLGIYIERSRASYAIDQVFAGVTVIAAVSVGIFLTILALQRWAVPWAEDGADLQGARAKGPR
jgi:ABC-type nitrate/sulfonate/bicarbonate transport system permease component